MPVRNNIYGIGTIEVHPKMDIRLAGMYSVQSKYQELVLGMALRYHLNLQRSREVSLLLGSNFRMNDAFIPTLELQYQAIKVGLSYDITVSDFQLATRRQGGPEISIEYIIRKVEEVKVFKACPIF